MGSLTGTAADLVQVAHVTKSFGPKQALRGKTGAVRRLALHRAYNVVVLA